MIWNIYWFRFKLARIFSVPKKSIVIKCFEMFSKVDKMQSPSLPKLTLKLKWKLELISLKPLFGRTGAKDSDVQFGKILLLFIFDWCWSSLSLDKMAASHISSPTLLLWVTWQVRIEEHLPEKKLHSHTTVQVWVKRSPQDPNRVTGLFTSVSGAAFFQFKFHSCHINKSTS